MTGRGRDIIAAAIAATLAGCATQGGNTGWITLIDGATGLDNFNRVGEANWSGKDGAIEASAGGKEQGFLVSKSSYKDFQMRVEFWASDNANSGIYMRCQDPPKITDESCHEANIFDQRPDQTYATGSITKFATVLQQPLPKAGGKWNVYEITARGPKLVVVLNGQKTAEVENSKFASGPFALQWAQGTIKFRKLEIKPL